MAATRPLADKAGEYALVWAVPVALWAAVFVNGVDDLEADKPGKLLLRVALAVVLTATASLWVHYLAVLDEDADELGGRVWKLRESLLDGGGFTQAYNRRLARLLDAVDRFFGDAGQSAPAWQRRMFFGLAPGCPLWTATAYDRCLLLALCYPIAVLLAGWVLAGHAGWAEAALGLRPDANSTERLLLALSMALCSDAAVRLDRAQGWRRNSVSGAYLVLAGFLAGITAFDIGGTGALTFAVAVAGYISVAIVGSGTSSFAFTVTTPVAGAVAFASDSSHAGIATFAIALAAALAAAGVTELVQRRFISRGLPHVFAPAFALVALGVCIGLVRSLAGMTEGRWALAGSLVLFFGLLTLLNAPFDWLSLGLTRGLLRRGVGLGGPAPWLLALLDAVLAGLLVLGLAATMVLGVQLFDALARWGAGQPPLLPMGPLLLGLAARPADPEHWWLHALLLSTLLPSLVNLSVAGFSMLRGWPALSAWLLCTLPAPGRPLQQPATRWVAALVLALQWVLGALLGIAAQALLVWGLFGGLLPRLGTSLLGLMGALAQQDWPERLVRAWWL